MKKLLNQFLIVTITFWIVTPLVDLFINNNPISGIEDYLNLTLILKSSVFGLIFTTVFNIVLK